MTYTPHGYHQQNSRVMVDRDVEHLRLLGVFHFVVGGLCLVILVFLVLLPLLLGPSYSNGVNSHKSAAQLVGDLIVGGLLTLILMLNGWSLKNHHNRISCMVMSIFECLSIPLGTILGVSAILVLRRESVKQLFERAKSQVAQHQ